MKERAREIRAANAEDGKSAFKKYIAPFISSIQQKITKEQYSTLEEFMEELKKLEAKIEKEGPNFVDSKLNCSLCINRVLAQGAGYIFKRVRNEK